MSNNRLHTYRGSADSPPLPVSRYVLYVSFSIAQLILTGLIAQL